MQLVEKHVIDKGELVNTFIGHSNLVYAVALCARCY